MNAYKIISLTPEILTVEWTIAGKDRTERLDARYLPVNDAEALNTELQRLLDAMAKDATPVEIPADVQAMVGQKTALEVKEVTLTE